MWRTISQLINNDDYSFWTQTAENSSTRESGIFPYLDSPFVLYIRMYHSNSLCTMIVCVCSHFTYLSDAIPLCHLQMGVESCTCMWMRNNSLRGSASCIFERGYIANTSIHLEVLSGAQAFASRDENKRSHSLGAIYYCLNIRSLYWRSFCSDRKCQLFTRWSCVYRSTGRYAG